jgi:hypothetical protein
MVAQPLMVTGFFPVFAKVSRPRPGSGWIVSSAWNPAAETAVDGLRDAEVGEGLPSEGEAALVVGFAGADAEALVEEGPPANSPAAAGVPVAEVPHAARKSASAAHETVPRTVMDRMGMETPSRL